MLILNPLKKMITRITEPKYDSRTIRNAKKNDLDHIAKTMLQPIGEYYSITTDITGHPTTAFEI